MGMILLLYLISTNVYNSVKAPSQRGFSYIELWQLGAQFPIIIALCEYGFVLFLKKGGYKSTKCQNDILNLYDPKPSLEEKIKILDYVTLIFSFVYFMLFVSLYWSILLFK